MTKVCMFVWVESGIVVMTIATGIVIYYFHRVALDNGHSGVIMVSEY